MFTTHCSGCNQLFGGENKRLRCTKCMWISYCSKLCQEKDWKRHKLICAMIVKNFDSPSIAREKFVKGELLKKHPAADSEKIEHVTEVLSKALKKDEKAKINYEFHLQKYGEYHEKTIQAKEKYKQAYDAVIEAEKQEQIDVILANLPFSSNPELRAITTREQLVELLSFANFEKCRKGLDDFDLLENALAQMKLAKETGGPAARTQTKPEETGVAKPEETGGPAARTPKKPEETGDHYQFCHKKGPTKHCSKCKQAFYCDKECQGKDWKKHKKTCKADAK